jgi:uncharacterized Zn-finger protein
MDFTYPPISTIPHNFQDTVDYISSQQLTSANVPAMVGYLNNPSSLFASTPSETHSGNSITWSFADIISPTMASSSMMLPCFGNLPIEMQGLLLTQRALGNNVLYGDGVPSVANANNIQHELPDVKKYQCDFCGKRFKSPSTLTTHKVGIVKILLIFYMFKRIHTGKKPYK